MSRKDIEREIQLDKMIMEERTSTSSKVGEALDFFHLDEGDAAILYETEGHPTEEHYRNIMKHWNVLKQALKVPTADEIDKLTLLIMKNIYNNHDILLYSTKLDVEHLTREILTTFFMNRSDE